MRLLKTLRINFFFLVKTFGKIKKTLQDQNLHLKKCKTVFSLKLKKPDVSSATIIYPILKQVH